MNKAKYLATAALNEASVWSDFHLKTNFSRPFMVMIEPTLRCPMACGFCDYPKENVFARSQELSVETWARIMRELREYNPVISDLYISGGEPFFRPDLCDILESAHRLGLRTRLLTIGALCSRSVCDRIVASPLEWLKFSIHSADPLEHDASVGRKGVFDRAVAAIRYLKERDYTGKLAFLTTITRLNSHRIVEVVRLAEDLGVNAVVLRPLFDQTRTIRTFGDDRTLSPDHKIEDIPNLRRLIAELKDLKRAGAPIANSEMQLDRIVAQSSGEEAGLPGCHLMYESIHIRPDGEVQVCGHMTLGSMGNVAERSVASVLSSMEAYEARHKVSRKCRCEANAYLKKSMLDKGRMALEYIRA